MHLTESGKSPHKTMRSIASCTLQPVSTVMPHLLNKTFSVKSTQNKSLKAYKKLYAILWTYRGTACDITAYCLTQKSAILGGGGGGGVGEYKCRWTVTKACYRAGSVDHEGGAVLSCNLLDI